jgi:NAD(P)-dependent dehydrogenase (short-subunit alcohol dehydrogenase family)
MSKNYLIVGATSAIGKAIVNQLNNEGANLYLTARNSKDLEGFEHSNIQSVDVTQDFELELPDRLDGIVYCPGSINLKPFHRLKTEDFLNDFQLNHLGAVKVIQQSLAALKKADNASIVMFSSVAAQTGLSFHSTISSAKAAIEGLARSLAAEFAPKIRVNVVAPSLTDTPLAEKLLSSTEKKKANAERHPLKEIGEPADIAEAALFFLGEQSKWVTGQILTVDGGIGSLR